MTLPSSNNERVPIDGNECGDSTRTVFLSVHLDSLSNDLVRAQEFDNSSPSDDQFFGESGVAFFNRIAF